MSPWIVFGLFSVSLTQGACGGSTKSGGGLDGAGGSVAEGDGGASGSGASTGLSGAAGAIEPAAHCPADAPTVGATCVPGLSCSYGDDLRSWCRSQYSCAQGRWTTDAPTCASLVECASLSDPPQDGAPCMERSDECSSKGTYCRCDLCLSGPCPGGMKWGCAVPPPGPCPERIPNEGAPCDTEQQTCAYGKCPIPGFEMTCIGSKWKAVGGGCPTSAG